MTALLQYIDLEKWQGGPRIIVGGFSPLSPPLCYALAHTLHTLTLAERKKEKCAYKFQACLYSGIVLLMHELFVKEK